MNRFTLALGIALYVVEASVATAILATSDGDNAAWPVIVLAVSAGAAFVGSGLIALVRRPENRTGVYLAATGYAWFFGALSDSDNEWVFIVGFVLGGVLWIPFSALVLAYPTGRLETRLERAIPVLVGALLFVPALLAALLDASPAPNCDGCPESPIAIVDSNVGDASDVFTTSAGLVLIVLIVAILVRRWRHASPALKRLLRPVVGTGTATLLAIGLVVIADQVSHRAADALWFVFIVCFAAVPVSFLFGILRSRLARSSVTDVVMALESGAPLRDALAQTLGDPSLEVVYRLGTGRWVDPSGRAVSEPAGGTGRKVTPVTRGGQPIAALLHDASLSEEPELIDAVTAAAGLSLHNERLQAELRAQYTFLETITDTAPSLLVNVDTEGRLLNQNQAAVSAAGFEDREEVRGRYFWDVFIDESDREAMKARFADAAPDFAVAEYENTFTNARGEQLVVYWRSVPVRDEDGRTVSIVAGGLDITERYRQEEEKKRERDFLSAIANHAPSLLCVIDEDGRVAYRRWDRVEHKIGATNIAFELLLGYEPGATSGEPGATGGHVFWESFVDPAEAEAVQARIECVVGGEALGEQDNHWVTSSGGRLVIAWTCTPLPRVDERTLFLITGVDVTERKRQEEALLAGEERLRATIHSAPVAVVEIDLDDCVTMWNPAAEQIFGWSSDEVLGKRVPFVPSNLEAEFRSRVGGVRAGNASMGHESIAQHRDGSLVEVEISQAPIRDTTGSVVGHIAVFSDITDRKRQESELRASRARIVAVADEARQQLERNLHDGAQQRLVALSVALRLVESKLSDDPEAASKLLADSRVELAHALEELRELARGIHPAVLTDRGLGPALEALVGRAGFPVELEIHRERLAPAVEAAAYYVVAEALTNVTKYGQASSAQVSVATVNGVLNVTIADDGVGGADPTRGSGLRGLVDRVEALDGHLSIDSAPGAGTRIRAEIPFGASSPK